MAFLIYLGSFPVSLLIYAFVLHRFLPTPKFRHAVGIVLILSAFGVAAVVVGYLFIYAWMLSAGP